MVTIAPRQARIIIDIDDEPEAVIEAFAAVAHHESTDASVLDYLAALLGGTPEWPGADMLETIAAVVGLVRDVPGSLTEPLAILRFLRDLNTARDARQPTG